MKVDFILIKYTCDLKSQILRIRYPSQSSGRPISHRNEWSFRVAAFTWYRWEISYWCELLAPVQQAGWTQAGVTRAVVTFWGGIIYRKIPKISAGADIFQRPFLRGLFLEGLIHGGAYFRNFTVSKYRATRGNRSELALMRKSPQCHVNKFDYISGAPSAKRASGAPWVSKSTHPEKLEMFTLTLSSYFGSPGSPWENWLHINIVINWQLSKQGIRWPVSPGRIYPGRVFFWSYPLTSY